MNERTMQFRIGLFVITAGIILVMMIVWFESPDVFRTKRYLTLYFKEATGVADGVPVRKSGVRIGEVTGYDFTRGGAGEPDGVVVTIALDPEHPLREGSTPRISRALIGDVAIDMIAGDGVKPMITYNSAADSRKREHWLIGEAAADPAAALSAATQIFDKVGGTLAAIEEASRGLSAVAARAPELEAFLKTWDATGQSVNKLSEDVDRVVLQNEQDIKPAIASIRRVADKIDATLDDKARDDVKTALDRLASASGRLDRVLADLEPVAQDLRVGPDAKAATNLGQALLRVNRITYDVSLLTSRLVDKNGRLNENSTLAKLVSDTTLYDNFNQLALAGRATIDSAKPVVRSFAVFADKVARDPSAISRGALQGR